MLTPNIKHQFFKNKNKTKIATKIDNSYLLYLIAVERKHTYKLGLFLSSNQWSWFVINPCLRVKCFTKLSERKPLNEDLLKAQIGYVIHITNVTFT